MPLFILRREAIYYALYPDQVVYEYDFENKTTTKIATHPRVKETLRMVVHPTGKYAYLLRQYNEKEMDISPVWTIILLQISSQPLISWREVRVEAVIVTE